MKRINIFVLCLMCLTAGTAHAQSRFYTASNVPVLIEGPSSVETRDKALIKAQRLALYALGGTMQAEQLKSVSDTVLSRTMKDFSLQNERVLPESYQARFTIRFDAMRFDGMMRTYNLNPPGVRQVDLKDMPLVADPLAQPASTADGAENVATTTTPEAVTAPVVNRIVLLPILKTGTKFLLWDEANMGRDAWQKKTDLPGGFALTVPLGDVEDLADVPQPGAIKPMTDEQPGFDRMLERYQAQIVYVLSAHVAQTGNGLNITMYRYKDKHMQKMGQATTTSRPGYLFDDGASFAANQIAGFEKPQPTLQQMAPQSPIANAMPPAQPLAVIPQAIASRGSMIAVVPISNLSAWVVIQQRLRRVEHVTNIMAQSLSTNQAVVRIDADGPVSTLISSLQANGFSVRQGTDGRYTITQQ